MKYGESTFDVLYLLFAIVSGLVILRRQTRPAHRLMGLAALILGLGDAFHLVPRVLNYFASGDFTAALGLGKLVTSLTMTAFYVLLYYVWLRQYGVRENRKLTCVVWILALLRAALCLFPQNRWLENGSDVFWGVLRNVPFVTLGACVVVLYFRARKRAAALRRVWFYITLSFLFYIPVAVAAGLVPTLGMLMLPKTVCYVLTIVSFLRQVAADRRERPA